MADLKLKTLWIPLFFVLSIILIAIIAAQTGSPFILNETIATAAGHYYSTPFLLLLSALASFILYGFYRLFPARYRCLTMLLISLFFISLLSYINIEKSIGINHFLFFTGLKQLKTNYHLFSEYHLKEFLYNTLLFHQGDSESSGSAFYYLVPLFLFLKSTGGLYLLNVHLFHISLSLISLVIFYHLTSYLWGEKEALFGTLLWGFSSWFQEFARSEVYITPSILIALLLILGWYHALHTKQTILFFLLGLLMGIAFYYYGMLRFLILLPLYVFICKKDRTVQEIVYFLSGFILILLPGIILRFQEGGRFFDEEHFFVCAPGYEYGEGLCDYLSKAHLNLKEYILRQFLLNLTVFDTMTTIQGIDYDPDHAHIMHKIVLFPLGIGILTAFRFRKEEKYRFLLFLSLIIIVLPLFITTNCSQIRRNVLWPIPLYMLLGIAFTKIAAILKNNKSGAVKYIGIFLLLSVLTSLYLTEIHRTCTYIWFRKQQLGISFLKAKLIDRQKKALLQYLDTFVPSQIDTFLQEKEENPLTEELIEEAIFDKRQVDDQVIYTVVRRYPPGNFDIERNGSFESGTLAGWEAYGEAFSFQPTFEDNPSFREHPQGANIQGKYWIGTYEKCPSVSFGRGGIQGDRPIGTLTSQEFVLSKPTLSFLIGGGRSHNTRIELLVNDTVVLFACGSNSETMLRTRWNVTPYLGEKARICIVDYSRVAWGHINCDDFKLEE